MCFYEYCIKSEINDVGNMSGEYDFALSLASSSPVNITSGPQPVNDNEGCVGGGLGLSQALRQRGNNTIEYAASREIRGLQETVGELAKSIQDIVHAIGDLGFKLSCLEEIMRGNYDEN